MEIQTETLQPSWGWHIKIPEQQRVLMGYRINKNRGDVTWTGQVAVGDGGVGEIIFHNVFGIIIDRRERIYFILSIA